MEISGFTSLDQNLQPIDQFPGNRPKRSNYIPYPAAYPIQQQQQQHKLYLHDYNYVVTVLQKL